jgi:hypothetical protein
MYARIGSVIYHTPESLAIVEKINQAIGSYQAEEQAIKADSEALIHQAMQAGPEDAPKLVKIVEALRLRRLKNVLKALRIPSMKPEATRLIRAAAAAEVARLRKSPDGGRRAIEAAQIIANNYRAEPPEDAAFTEELRARIEALLK